MTAVNTFLQVDLADVDGFTREFLEELQFGQGVTLARATPNDLYMALARTVRQQLMSRWLDTVSTQMRAQAKVVAYLSAEYLLGRQLDNALLAAGLTETAERSMRSLGLDLDRLRDAEVEPGLGNGGLGRLAACFIDSLATLQIPAVGYGIRYEYGIFRQTFVDGGQVEQPDLWLANGSPWEFPRPEMAGHRPVRRADPTLRGCRRGHPVAVGPRLGGARRPLQLHGARVPHGQRQHPAAVERQGDGRLRPGGLQRRRLPAGGPRRRPSPRTSARCCTRTTRPRRAGSCGCSSSTSSSPARCATSSTTACPATSTWPRLPERVIFQLNDTHPVIAIPELMRILIDEQRMDWDQAWDVSRRCFAYTCHTLLPEALEIWPIELLGPAAATAPGDHLPDQRRFPGRGARRSPRRRVPGPQDVDHPGGPGAGGPDGVPGHRRRIQRERRRGTAQPAAAGPGARGLRRVLAGRSSPT